MVLVSADVAPTTARTGEMLLADEPAVAAKLDGIVRRHHTNNSPPARRLSALGAPARRALLEELMDGLRALLDDELTDLLADAWSSHRAVVAALRETGGFAGAQSTIRLAPHTVRVQQEPELDLRVDGMKMLTLRVRLELLFAVTEAVALVRGGRLVEIRADNPKLHAVLTVNREEIASRDGRLVLGGRLLFP